MDRLLSQQSPDRNRSQSRHPPHCLPSRTRRSNGRRWVQPYQQPRTLWRCCRTVTSWRRKRNGWFSTSLRRQHPNPGASRWCYTKPAFRSPKLLSCTQLWWIDQTGRSHLQPSRRWKHNATRLSRPAQWQLWSSRRRNDCRCMFTRSTCRCSELSLTIARATSACNWRNQRHCQRTPESKKPRPLGRPWYPVFRRNRRTQRIGRTHQHPSLLHNARKVCL